MEEDVTVVNELNCDTILAAAPTILELFGVIVERLDAVEGGVFIKTSSAAGPASSSRSSDGPSSSDKQQSSDGDSGVITHPAVAEDVGLDSVNSAKAYMRCLTCDDSLRHVHMTQYDTDVYAVLQHNSGAIERQTQAVIACDDNTRTVTISGLRENVAMAMALTNRMLSNVAQLHHMTLGPSTSTDGTIYHSKDVATCLSALARHEGLCRTVSGNNNSIPKSQSDSAMCKKKALCRTRTLQEDLSAAAYADKIEFALKLGYTENQLRCVLEKLGWHVGKNELLSALVQLGSLEKSDNESDELGDLNRSGQSDSDVSGCDLDLTANSDDCSEMGESSNLRPVVIDGSNVAMSHGSKKVFSCYGIKLTVDWFRKRGHMEITVFVPQWRKETSRPDSLITDQEILLELEKEKVLVFTPARRVCGKRIVCYDDRYIIKLAAENGGVVVSNDNYRDLINESTEYKKVIEERLLMYSFVNDRFMPPEDPLGRRGPSLDNFLRMAPLLPDPLPPTCPYGKKCTYGNKCRYYHPERGLQPHRSVVEKLAERADKNRLAARGHPTASPTNSLTGGSSQKPASAKTPIKRALTKTRSLVTGGCVSKTPLGPRNSMCCSSISRDVCSDVSDIQVTKKVTSPDDLDMSKMTVSVRVSQGNVADTTFCHATEQPTMVTQEDSMMTLHDRRSIGLPNQGQGNSGAVLHHGMHELPKSGGSMVREDCVRANEAWACSSHILLPSRSEPSHLHLGSGHLSLARKLSDESRLSLQRELSPKGAEDSRLLSADGITKQQPKADWFNEANDAEKWFVSNSARSSPQLERPVATSAASTTETSGTGFRRRKSCGRVAPQYDLLRQFRTDHSPLNRNLSAPVTMATALPFPRSSGSTMQRQSSTSDPLLHTKDDGAYVMMPTEVPPGGCVVTTPPVSWSFSTENKFQHRSPVYRAAPPSVTSLGSNRQIKVAFTPMVQQPFPARQRLVKTQPPVVHMSSDAMMDAFVSRSPNHTIPVDVSPMSRQQAEVMRSYGNVPSHVHVAEPAAMNATVQQHMIPNLSQPPPSYQVAPQVAAVSEKRRNLYFHLCGLFPEEKVSHVMQQYPTETSPQILCTHLIRMSYV